MKKILGLIAITMTFTMFPAATPEQLTKGLKEIGAKVQDLEERFNTFEAKILGKTAHNESTIHEHAEATISPALPIEGPGLAHIPAHTPLESVASTIPEAPPMDEPAASNIPPAPPMEEPAPAAPIKGTTTIKPAAPKPAQKLVGHINPITAQDLQKGAKGLKPVNTSTPAAPAPAATAPAKPSLMDQIRAGLGNKFSGANAAVPTNNNAEAWED
jgi:hypothetical protein